MATRHWFTVLAVCAAYSSLRAEDVYRVKLKESAAGDVSHVEFTDTLNVIWKIVDADGMSIVNRYRYDETLVYNETVLERKVGERPTRLSRQYEKAEETEDGKKRALPYQGKTVLIEKKGCKYHFLFEGGKEMSPEDATALDDEFNGDPTRDEANLVRLMLPAKPVALNDVWNADIGQLLKQTSPKNGVALDPDKANGTALLTKVYKMGDRQYGVLHGDAEVPVTSLGNGARSCILDDGKLTYQIDLDACIDGLLDEGTVKVISKLNGSGSTSLPSGGRGKFTLIDEDSTTTTRHECVARDVPPGK